MVRYSGASQLRLFITAMLMVTSTAHAADHLLITEIVLTPSEGEFIEIYNPTGAVIDLSQYYLADFVGYWRVANGGVLPMASDFVAKFPRGASIAAGQVVTVAMNGSSFVTLYSVNPSFEMPPSTIGNVPDMVAPYTDSIGSGRSLNDVGEGVTLYFWDGLSDLVKDVDIIRAGVPSASNDIAAKTGITIDGPDADSTPSTFATDAMTMPVMGAAAGSGFSHKRLYIECGNEVSTAGNGIGGHDETTENIAVTWDGSPGGPGFSAPTPNVIGTLGSAPGNCLADIAPAKGNNKVDVDDLLAVINSWGLCNGCAADIAPCGGNGQVNVDDLLLVINSWGRCP